MRYEYVGEWLTTLKAYVFAIDHKNFKKQFIWNMDENSTFVQMNMTKLSIKHSRPVV